MPMSFIYGPGNGVVGESGGESQAGMTCKGLSGNPVWMYTGFKLQLESLILAQNER